LEVSSQTRASVALTQAKSTRYPVVFPVSVVEVSLPRLNKLNSMV
jgi:hypothetical protein